MASERDNPQGLLNRRQFAGRAGATLLVGSLPGCVATPQLNIEAVGETPLKDRAAGKGLLCGMAVRRKQLKDPAYSAPLKADFNLLVPEYEIQWDRVEPRPGADSFRKPDRISAFAEANGMAFRGHSLLWHGATPDWAEAALRERPAQGMDLLARHIRFVAGHYAGKIHSWDVVNEVIEPEHGRPDGLRESVFLKALGPDYIEHAFRVAAEADPKAMLVLNEYGQEWSWDGGRRRRSSLLKLLERLLAKGTPVHAVGLQGHLAPGIEGYLSQSALRDFCDEVTGMGFRLLVTEADARDTGIQGSLETHDRLVADAYSRFLDVVLDQKALDLVLFWGLTDRHSWLDRFFPRKDGDLVRGALYDKDYNRKRAWYAVADAFDRARR